MKRATFDGGYRNWNKSGREREQGICSRGSSRWGIKRAEKQVRVEELLVEGHTRKAGRRPSELLFLNTGDMIAAVGRGQSSDDGWWEGLADGKQVEIGKGKRKSRYGSRSKPDVVWCVCVSACVRGLENSHCSTAGCTSRTWRLPTSQRLSFVPQHRSPSPLCTHTVKFPVHSLSRTSQARFITANSGAA